MFLSQQWRYFYLIFLIRSYSIGVEIWPPVLGASRSAYWPCVSTLLRHEDGGGREGTVGVGYTHQGCFQSPKNVGECRICSGKYRPASLLMSRRAIRDFLDAAGLREGVWRLKEHRKCFAELCVCVFVIPAVLYTCFDWVSFCRE